MEKNQMKKYLLLTLVFSFINHAAPLAGDYFINQNGSEDYSSISAAVADLNSEGISAPVNFKIRSGTYDEQVTVTEINRTGLNTDLVKFRRATPADTVIWKYTSQSPADNWIVKLDDAEFVSIINITFEAVNDDAQTMLSYEGTTDSVTVTNCIFDGLIPASTDFVKNDLVFISPTNFAPSNASTGYRFDGNNFKVGFRGLLISNNPSTAYIRNNTFSGQANAGIVLTSTTSDNVIESNTISDAIWTVTSLPYTALNISARGIVRNNKINIGQKGAVGINASYSFAPPLLVYNNFISITNPNGNTIAAQLGKSVKFLHNSIRTEHATDIGIQINAIKSNTVTINNNIIMNVGGGVALDLPLDDNVEALNEITDNNFYTSGAILASWGETSPGVSRTFADISSLHDHVQTTFPNVGLSEFLFFVGTTSGDINDLHLPVILVIKPNLLAHPQADVTDDIDGDARTSINVYIGADQSPFVVAPMDNADANNGSFYAVGGSTPDFLTVQEALENLYHRGTKAEVTLRIRAGSYPTKINISNLVRLDESDLVTIIAANPANHPVLTLVSSAIEHSIIKLTNTNNIVIKNIDFEIVGATNNGITIRGSHSNVIEDCQFTDGKYGIRIESDFSSHKKNSLINNNFISQIESAITVNNMHGQTISGNVINSNYSTFKGIDIINTVSNQTYQTIIENNEITACSFSPDCVGININNGNGSEDYRALIKNNFIFASTGIKLENTSRYWDIYHNTISTHRIGIITQAGSGSDSNNINIINNIITASSNNTYISINSGSVQESENINIDFNVYNNISSSNLIEWFSATYSDLQNFSIVTGMDNNSLQKNLNFVDQPNRDYHLSGLSIGDNDLAGSDINITTDIDGDSRSNDFPYIGADEASTPLSVARVYVSAENTTSENSAQANIGVRLLAQPTDDVTVAFATDNINEGIVIPSAQLVFTSTNWNQLQNVIIQGVDDLISDGNIDYSVLYSVLSDDAEYDAIPVQVLEFVNLDNDLNSKIALELVNHAIEPATSATVKFKLLNNAAAPNDSALRDTQDITIDYTYNGNTATVDSDYTALSGSVVLPALNEFIEININPIDDNFIEGTEDLNITITSISGGLASVSIDNSTNGLVVSIEDNETGLISVSNSQNLSEPATNGGFELTLTGGISETDTEINYSLAGTANHTSDYMQVSGIATISAMASSVIIPVSVLNDIDSEDQETITISLNNTSNPLVSTNTTTPPFATINDDDTDADIEVIISAINPAVAVGEAFDITLTLINHDAINIHQAVLQVDEPAGLDFSIWRCLASSSYCSQSPGSGNLVDVVSIAANSQIQFAVSALVTGTLSDTINIQAILNPAPFLNDTDTNNNTADASSLIDVFFENGFENSINNRLFQAITGFNQQDDLAANYYYISYNNETYHFIKIIAEQKSIKYQHIYVNTENESIISSKWISND